MTATVALLCALSVAAVLAWPSPGRPAQRLAALRLGPAAGRTRAADHARRDGDSAWSRRVALRRIGLVPWVGRVSAAEHRLRPDLVMELVACGLRAGLAVSDAVGAAAPGARSAYLDVVVGRLRLGVPPRQAWARPPPEYAGLATALVLADLSGAPAAAVVARAAADQRAERRERAELAAARLGVRLVLPLGLAVLPGFVLLGVVPILLGLATTVLGAGG